MTCRDQSTGSLPTSGYTRRVLRSFVAGPCQTFASADQVFEADCWAFTSTAGVPRHILTHSQYSLKPARTLHDFAIPSLRYPHESASHRMARVVEHTHDVAIRRLRFRGMPSSAAGAVPDL